MRPTAPVAPTTPIRGRSLIDAPPLQTSPPATADAAREVEGVAGLVETPPHRGKAVVEFIDEDTLSVGIALELEWGDAPPRSL
jgi:hypothetical protein